MSLMLRYTVFKQLRYGYCAAKSCETLFPDVEMQLKMYFFDPFLRPCMHRNYGVISGSPACRDCVWHIILNAEVYTTLPGERMLLVIRCNVRFPHLRHCKEQTCTCFWKDDRKSNNVWLRALMQSNCLYSSLFFEHYIRILLCDCVLGHCSACSFECVSCHNAFVLFLASNSFGI